MAYNDYELQSNKCETRDIRPLITKENIEYQLKKAEAELRRLSELKQLIERNPDIERILTLMNR